MVRNEVRREARRIPARQNARMEHLEEAIRHLHEAEMPEAAASLETELAKLRTRHDDGERELQRTIEERDALRKELRALKRELQGLKKEPKSAPAPSAENK